MARRVASVEHGGVLGRTQLEVSVMGLGAGGDSRLGAKTDAERSVQLVRSALRRGVDFIDTAEAYGTEAVIGTVVSRRL